MRRIPFIMITLITILTMSTYSLINEIRLMSAKPIKELHILDNYFVGESPTPRSSSLSKELLPDDEYQEYIDEELMDFLDAFKKVWFMSTDVDTIFEANEFSDIDGYYETIYIATFVDILLPIYCAGLPEGSKDVLGSSSRGIIEASKIRNDDVVITSIDGNYLRDFVFQKQGDNHLGNIIMDNNNASLSTDEKISRDGEVITRYVQEIVKLTDGSFIIQILQVGDFSPEYLRNNTAVFMLVGENDAEIIIAELEEDFDFTYNSIIGKENITPDQMADGYKVTAALTVENGKVTNFEKIPPVQLKNI